MTTSASSGPFSIDPIGVVSSNRSEAIDDEWGGVVATITLRSPLGPDSLRGLDAFSHVEVIYLFHRLLPASLCVGSRVPRSNPAWPEVGILAQRAKDRPNRLGLSTCELVDVAGRILRVRGLDAIDGTPVVDIKPYMTEFAPRGAVRQPRWSHELMANYF